MEIIPGISAGRVWEIRLRELSCAGWCRLYRFLRVQLCEKMLMTEIALTAGPGRRRERDDVVGGRTII